MEVGLLDIMDMVMIIHNKRLVTNFGTPALIGQQESAGETKVVKGKAEKPILKEEIKTYRSHSYVKFFFFLWPLCYY